MYMDCREMNKVTIRNRYPIPGIKDPSSTLHNIIIYDAFALMNMFNFQCFFTPTWSIGPFLVTKIKNIFNQNLIGSINKHVNFQQLYYEISQFIQIVVTYNTLDRFIVIRCFCEYFRWFLRYAVQEEVIFIIYGLIYTNCHNYKNLIINN